MSEQPLNPTTAPAPDSGTADEATPADPPATGSVAEAPAGDTPATDVHTAGPGPKRLRPTHP